MPDTPNIIGGSRVVCAAAIVCLSILLCVLVAITIAYFSPSGPASANLHVDAGLF